MTAPRNVLLTGGAGYIGKCTAILLKSHGYHPIVFDNFTTSKCFEWPKLDCLEVDLTDATATRAAWKTLPEIHAVFHFAAKALVGESWEQPHAYFHNNVTSALNVAQQTAETPTCHLLHSSSCAVYGIPDVLPLTEDTPTKPISPYGESKFMVERALYYFREAKGLSVLNLRYFNPAGAIPFEGKWLGEHHSPETHLLPNVIEAIRRGSPFRLFGTDYPTPDGTCIRDFIHIEDLALAHLKALAFLEKTPRAQVPEAINLGGGKGISVLEAGRAAERIIGKPLKVSHEPRRPGDPAQLVAGIGRAQKLLGWQPTRNLEDMITSHLQFLEGRP